MTIIPEGQKWGRFSISIIYAILNVCFMSTTIDRGGGRSRGRCCLRKFVLVSALSLCLLKHPFSFPSLCFPVLSSQTQTALLWGALEAPGSKDPTLLASRLLLYANSTCLHQSPSLTTPTPSSTQRPFPESTQTPAPSPQSSLDGLPCIILPLPAWHFPPLPFPTILCSKPVRPSDNLLSI